MPSCPCVPRCVPVYATQSSVALPPKPMVCQSRDGTKTRSWKKDVPKSPVCTLTSYVHRVGPLGRRTAFILPMLAWRRRRPTGAAPRQPRPPRRPPRRPRHAGGGWLGRSDRPPVHRQPHGCRWSARRGGRLQRAGGAGCAQRPTPPIASIPVPPGGRGQAPWAGPPTTRLRAGGGAAAGFQRRPRRAGVRACKVGHLRHRSIVFSSAGGWVMEHVGS